VIPSFRTAVTRAYRVAAAKLRAGECLALPVPSSIDVARELREWFPDILPEEACELATVCGFKVADGDSIRPPQRLSVPPALAAREWAATAT